MNQRSLSKFMVGATMALGVFVAASVVSAAVVLVDTVVWDYNTSPYTLRESWIDTISLERWYEYRELGIDDLPDQKCSGSGMCTSTTLHCAMLPPGGTATCNYCVLGGGAATNSNFCYAYSTGVCTMVQDPTVTCGTKWEATCTVTGCNGGTPATAGTCTMKKCV